jgi:hypothetical protein
MLAIRKARTSSELFLEVKERLADKDFKNQEEGTTQTVQTITNQQ